jgi:radial spoke head protein 9
MTVYAIENDCHIVPKGSFKLTDMHEVHRNNAFRGLSIDDAVRVECYSHFKACQAADKVTALTHDECVFRDDFLDEAFLQTTKGCLTGQRVSTKGNIALIRNHLWSGYATYHVANSNVHGSFYFGDGQKNMDFVFQI